MAFVMTLSLYFMLIPASASGGQFGDLKALKSPEILMLRLPLNNLELKNMLIPNPGMTFGMLGRGDLYGGD